MTGRKLSKQRKVGSSYHVGNNKSNHHVAQNVVANTLPSQSMALLGMTLDTRDSTVNLPLSTTNRPFPTQEQCSRSFKRGSPTYLLISRLGTRLTRCGPVDNTLPQTSGWWLRHSKYLYHCMIDQPTSRQQDAGGILDCPNAVVCASGLPPKIARISSFTLATPLYVKPMARMPRSISR